MNTGIYRSGDDSLAFSSGGEKVLQIDSDGINIGNPQNIGSIKRASSSSNTAWEDGYLGNANFIPFIASDFDAIEKNNSGGFQTIKSLDGANNYENGSMRFNHDTIMNDPTNNKIFVSAIKVLPKGFRVATGNVKLNEIKSPSLTTPSGTISIYEYNIQSSSPRILLAQSNLSLNAHIENITIINSSSISDGSTCIMIEIDFDASPKGYYFNNGPGLESVLVPIERQ